MHKVKVTLFISPAFINIIQRMSWARHIECCQTFFKYFCWRPPCNLLATTVNFFQQHNIYWILLHILHYYNGSSIAVDLQEFSEFNGRSSCCNLVWIGFNFNLFNSVMPRSLLFSLNRCHIVYCTLYFWCGDQFSSNHLHVYWLWVYS